MGHVECVQELLSVTKPTAVDDVRALRCQHRRSWRVNVCVIARPACVVCPRWAEPRKTCSHPPRTMQSFELRCCADSVACPLVHLPDRRHENNTRPPTHIVQPPPVWMSLCKRPHHQQQQRLSSTCPAAGTPLPGRWHHMTAALGVIGIWVYSCVTCSGDGLTCRDSFLLVCVCVCVCVCGYVHGLPGCVTGPANPRSLTVAQIARHVGSPRHLLRSRGGPPVPTRTPLPGGWC